MAEYSGTVTAAYVNVSKKGKEYANGYIRLPDANGNLSSYKFLVFDENEVNKIKEVGPDSLKGKELRVEAEFKENTWNGNTEYQLFVNKIISALGGSAPESTTSQEQQAPSAPSTPSAPQVPEGTTQEAQPDATMPPPPPPSM